MTSVSIRDGSHTQPPNSTARWRPATANPRARCSRPRHTTISEARMCARPALLSEIPEDWTRTLERWLDLSASHRRLSHDMPSAGDVAILFQTIVGAWPDGLMITDQRGLTAYCKRLMLWQQKALREAKLHSDWAEPNRAYEAAASDFIAWLFSGSSELLP